MKTLVSCIACVDILMIFIWIIAILDVHLETIYGFIIYVEWHINIFYRSRANIFYILCLAGNFESILIQTNRSEAQNRDKNYKVDSKVKIKRQKMTAPFQVTYLRKSTRINVFPRINSRNSTDFDLFRDFSYNCMYFFCEKRFS